MQLIKLAKLFNIILINIILSAVLIANSKTKARKNDEAVSINLILALF